MLGQRRNQVSILMRRGRVSVKQDQLGGALLAVLAVEDVGTIDLGALELHAALLVASAAFGGPLAVRSRGVPPAAVARASAAARPKGAAGTTARVRPGAWARI